MQTNRLLRVVSVFDDAIDRARTSREQIETYAGKWNASTGRWDPPGTRDYSLLTFKADKLPTIYHVRRIPIHTMTRFVEEPDSLAQQRERAFMCGIDRIENLRDADGNLLAPRAPGKKFETATGETYWFSEGEIEEMIDLGALDKPTIDEVGGVALTRGGLRRASGAAYRLPHSCLDAWADLVCRHVATTAPTLHPNNTAHVSEQTT